MDLEFGLELYKHAGFIDSMPMDIMPNSWMPNSWTPNGEGDEQRAGVCVHYLRYYVSLSLLPSGPFVIQSNSVLGISAFSPVRYSKVRHLVAFGLQSNMAFEISVLSLIRHSQIRHSVQFGIGEFGIRDFGIKSHSALKNSAFSPIRYWGFGVQGFGTMSFGIQSVNRMMQSSKQIADFGRF